MIIGLVLPAVPGYSETFFRSKIKGLKQAGHDVLLFAKGNPAEFDLCKVIPNPRVYRFLPYQMVVMLWKIGWLLLSNPQTVLRFYRLERQSGNSFRKIIENIYLNSHILLRRLDWLHFGFVSMAVRSENVAKAIGAKMAVSLRGYDICLYPLKHPGCYELTWQRVDKVHTISDDLLEVAHEQGLPKGIRVQKITPAIDVSKFTGTNPDRPFHTPLRLLTVARLHWKKGLEYTLEALALLRRRSIDFTYTILGDGSELERLVFAAHQLGIADLVTFAGKVSHEEVKIAMEAADIYLQYSVQEGFCNAVLEAQAMGLLCIVSDAEGLPENVLDGRTGWVVPKRRPDLLAQRIEFVLKLDEQQLRQVRLEAMNRVKRDFNLEKQQREFLTFYSG